jgi:hypothetical protein
MTRWRVDAEGQRARRCATFETAVAAAVKMAAPGVSWVSIHEVDGWADISIQLDWKAGKERITGSRTWVQGQAIVKAMRPHLAENMEGAT